MKLYTDLSLTAQTAYAQLLDAAMAAQMARSISDLGGSFASKTVKGAKYWYYQYTEPNGKLRQLYVGPESEAVQMLIARKAQPGASSHLAKLARSAMALGCTPINRRHFRVIKRLAEYGFFQAGGVLVGTHAFPVSANMLGIQWGNPHETQDIDLAHAGKNIAVALPSNVELSTHKAIESLDMGFLPVTSLTSKIGASYLNPQEPDFRLDFLTTLHRGGEEPYEHSQIGITLQPLKFMEFSLEQVQQAALFCEDGAIVVNVPHPARYALHKLIVFGERTGEFTTKSNKDLLQAASLISYYKDQREWEIQEAWDDLITRGKGWLSRTRQGMAAMERVYPDLRAEEILKLPETGNTQRKSDAPVEVFIRCERDSLSFLSSLGVDVNDYNEDKKGVFATIKTSDIQAINQFPADFTVTPQHKPAATVAPTALPPTGVGAADHRHEIEPGH